MNFLNKKQETEETENVSVIDNNLVISLMKTENPVIWRMPLDEIGTAVFSIKKDKKKSTLILKRKDNSEEIIATFNNTEDATKILNSISHHLLNPSHSKPQRTWKTVNKTINEKTNDNNKTESMKWVGALLFALVVIGLYAYLMSIMPEQIGGPNAINAQTSAETPSSQTGQPISADEFLKGL